MDTPAEVTFVPLLLAGIGLLLLTAGAFVWFVLSYQRRLAGQQQRLHGTETAHQQQLLAAVIAAQEAERERIGRDLHDDVASSVAMARMLVDRLAAGPPADEHAAVLDLAREVLGNAVDEVRNVSHDLYPVMLGRMGLTPALEHLAALCRRTAALDVELDVDYPRPLPISQELAIYRICQELVHNTLKHADATRVAIRLRQHGPLLVLDVEDDGRGFEAEANGDGSASSGIGMQSILVRVEMLRARLEQRSSPGQGSRTRIEFDNPAAAA